MSSALTFIAGASCGFAAAALLLDWLAARRREPAVHVTVHLDGKVVAESVRRRLLEHRGLEGLRWT